MNTQKLVCIIPSRYKSSRFEGKSLFPILGKPMVQWVAEHAKEASLVSRVIVATDDERIKEVVQSAGQEAVMTPDCPNGSARVAYVSKDINEEWIFEMQGDQPLVTPGIIDNFIKHSLSAIEKNSAIDVVIPYASVGEMETNSPDILKVVKTEKDRLVFQTRLPIHTGWRTLGLYVWKRSALLRFAELPVSRIERAEDSHPIRLYINDFYVHGLPLEGDTWIEVDRESQVSEVERLMREGRIV